MNQTFYNSREGRLTKYNPLTGAWTQDGILYQDTEDSVSHQPKQPSIGFYQAVDVSFRNILAEVHKTSKHRFLFDNSRLDAFTGIGFVQGISDTPNKPDTDFVMYLVREDHKGNGESSFSNADYRFDLTSDNALPYFQNGNLGVFFNDSVRRLLELDKKV